MKSIIHTPNPVLTTPGKPVNHIDKKIHRLISEMKDTLQQATHPKGVGLAAPQVGIGLMIFLMQADETNPIQVFINPQIDSISSKLTTGIPDKEGKLEGCLSIPKVWGLVKRAAWVKLKYLNELGVEKTTTFRGFESVIIQHEFDHLQGILFPRRILEQKGKLYQSTTDEKGEEVLEPLEI